MIEENLVDMIARDNGWNPLTNGETMVVSYFDSIGHKRTYEIKRVDEISPHEELGRKIRSWEDENGRPADIADMAAIAKEVFPD